MRLTLVDDKLKYLLRQLFGSKLERIEILLYFIEHEKAQSVESLRLLFHISHSNAENIVNDFAEAGLLIASRKVQSMVYSIWLNKSSPITKSLISFLNALQSEGGEKAMSDARSKLEK